MKGKRVLAAMVAVLLLATALRFYRLDAQSFWNDEGNSARLSERSVRLIIEGTASDIHPPLYYLLLRGWREIVGESEFALRAMSAFFGLGLVAVTFALGRRLLRPDGEEPALLAALLMAVNPALVYYSQEARMYEMMAFLAILSTLLLIRLLQTPNRRTTVTVAYVLCVTAGLYTHYFFPAILFAQGLIVLAWLVYRRRSAATEAQTNRREPGPRLRLWPFMLGAIFLLYLPWLPIFLRQAGGRAGTRINLAQYLLDSGRWLLVGETIVAPQARLPLLAAALLLVLALLMVVWKRAGRGSVFAALFLLAAIPVLLMWLVGATQPALYKFLLLAIPPLLLLLGYAWWSGWHFFGRGTFKIPGRILLVLAAVLLLWGSGRSLQNMYFDAAFARADYRAIAQEIAAEAHPNAAIVLNAANQWEVFTYYHRDGAPVFPLPRSRPDPAAIDAELADIAANYERIYALFWGEAERDPQRLVESWLDRHAYKAQDRWVSDVRFVAYAVPDEPVSDMTTETNLPIGDRITLQGYSLSRDAVLPGDILPLTLYWQATKALDQRYKVFLHLTNEAGEIVAQRDSEPGGGLAPTTTWLPGETIVDNYGLLIPDGLSGGRYELLLGLYAVDDPAKRLTIDAPEAVLDAYPLATISVEGD